jgi:hypothetical protein
MNFTGNWNTSKYKVTELFKASVVVMELGMLERATSIMGGVCIFDLGGVGLSHVWNITPAVAETVVDLLVVRALAALSPPSVTLSPAIDTRASFFFLLPATRTGQIFYFLAKATRSAKTLAVNIRAQSRRVLCFRELF